MLPSEAAYYFCKADIPRGMEASKLSEMAEAKGLKGEVYNSVHEALAAAQKNASARDLVFIGGSTFTVAEVV
jgi:dihydrofolate synthase/folylpolyglutamate synthase